jgi:hypothetical protein
MDLHERCFLEFLSALVAMDRLWLGSLSRDGVSRGHGAEGVVYVRSVVSVFCVVL